MKVITKNFSNYLQRGQNIDYFDLYIYYQKYDPCNIRLLEDYPSKINDYIYNHMANVNTLDTRRNKYRRIWYSWNFYDEHYNWILQLSIILR